MKKLLIATMGSLLLTSALQAQTAVTAGMMYGKKYGVTYMLPKTQLEIQVAATKHTFKPGEFCKYADLYLHMSDVQTQAADYWTLDEATVRSIGVADKEKVYFVELKDKTVAPLMELTAEGTIYSINLPFSGKSVERATPTASPQKVKPDARSFFTEEILAATSTAKMAELVAQEIYNIRDSKNTLVRGEADNLPKDGAQLQIMLDNLNLQEEVLTELFTGVTTTESQTFTFRIDPEMAANKVAFRFSQKLGVLQSDDLAGEPAYITVANQGLITPQSPEEAAKNKKELEGIAYNVPGKALVTLTFNQSQLFREELPITQLGSVEYLASSLFNKNATTTVLFDGNTGALVKVDRE